MSLDVDGNTFLHLLYLDAMKIDKDVVAKDLLSKGVDINAINLYGETVLHLCLMRGHNGSFLLKNGANTNIQDNMGNLPLHSYMQSQVYNMEFLKELCEATKDHSTKDDEGDAPIDVAIKMGYKDPVISLLWEYRVGINRDMKELKL